MAVDWDSTEWGTHVYGCEHLVSRKPLPANPLVTESDCGSWLPEKTRSK